MASPTRAASARFAGYHLSNGIAVNYQVAQEVVKDDKGNPRPCSMPMENRRWMKQGSSPFYQMQDSQDKDGNPGGLPTRMAIPFTDPTRGLRRSQSTILARRGP